MLDPTPLPTLDREQLRARLAATKDLKLVMAGSAWAFQTKHLPGSLHFDHEAEMWKGLKIDDEIVVYCSNVDCHASKATAQKLIDHGYRNVSHYAGGLIDWEAAGLPIEGNWAP